MPPIMANSKDGQDHKDKYLEDLHWRNANVQYESSYSNIYLKIMKLFTRTTHVKYQNSSTHCSKIMSKVKVFKKMGQAPRSKSQGQK